MVLMRQNGGVTTLTQDIPKNSCNLSIVPLPMVGGQRPPAVRGGRRPLALPLLLVLENIRPVNPASVNHCTAAEWPDGVLLPPSLLQLLLLLTTDTCPHCTVGSSRTDGVRGFRVKTPHLRPHCALGTRHLCLWPPCACGPTLTLLFPSAGTLENHCLSCSNVLRKLPSEVVSESGGGGVERQVPLV
jgi:hypothetical protein